MSHGSCVVARSLEPSMGLEHKNPSEPEVGHLV